MTPHISDRSHAAGARTLNSAVPVLLAVIAMALVASASASTAPPSSPTFLGANNANGGLQVEPTTITYTGDGTGLLGGAHVRNAGSGVHWTKWTGSVAIGTGFNQLNNCRPDCARGRFRGYPVRIELWRARTLRGLKLFTRMTIFYTRSRPHGEPRHYTFTDTYAAGGYGWGPPDAQGYCVHTYGLPPAPGCKDIHELP